MNEQEIRAIVRDEIAKAAVGGPGHDPTGEGSAYQPPTCQGEGHAKSAGPLQFPRVVAWPTEEHPCLTDPPNLPGSGPQLREAVQAIQESAEPTPEPAPGSDAEHPPVGYRLANVGDEIHEKAVGWDYGHGPWSQIEEHNVGVSYDPDCHQPIANPIPAADGDSQASEHRVFVPVVGYSWIPGTPPAPYASEWFFAKLDTGEAVALRELPAGHSYDYKTADETFFSNGRVVAWMQNPDSEYVAHVTDGASQICAECAKLRIENAGHRDEISYLHAIAQRETERADASTGRAVLAEREAARMRDALEKIAAISANENTDPDGMADALAMIQGTVRRATAREGAKG